MYINKSKNGFSLSFEEVSFEFKSKKRPYESGGICSLETVGKIPVPEILKGDRNT